MFRFTIRDVLWLTVLVAMGAGWWVDHRRAGAEVDRLYSELVRNIKWTPAGPGAKSVNEAQDSN